MQRELNQFGETQYLLPITPMRHITPLHDNIIVEEHIEAQDSHSKGGIYLGALHTRNQYFYKVLSVGPKVAVLKVGDIVWINPDAAKRPATLDDNKVWRVKEEDVMYKRL